ncbi:hypothetical protein Chor_009392 [Crotalus horridus]
MEEHFSESSLRSREEERGSDGGHEVSPSLFLQLPSNQTLRFRGKKAETWEAAWEGVSVPIEDSHGLVPEMLLEEEGEDSRLLKEMPLCLEEKRKLRMLQKEAIKQLSGWQLWRREKSKSLRRLQSQASIAISSAELWRGTLHHIEGHFGTGIQSYFNFLRFLVLLNFAASLLVVGFMIAPNAAFEALQLNWTSQANSSLGLGSVLCLKQSLVSEDTSLALYSNKIFAGWDFSLMQDKMVQLKHKSIRYELRTDSPEKSQYFLQLLVAYLPSVVITAANLLMGRYQVEEGFKEMNANTKSLSRMLVTYWPSCLLIKWWGEQEFVVPDNILNLVYGQTLCWTGALFCPLLPVLNTIKYTAIFYLKKVILQQLLSVISSYHLTPNFPYRLPPSKACGPFRNQSIMWNVVSKAVSELPASAQNFLRFVGSVAFSAPLFLLLSVFMFYLKALANSYSSRIKGLKGQLRLKSWHVRNKDNVARVRRDEAEAEVQRQKREARVLLAEQEARTELLRKKARLSAPGGDKSGSDLISLDSEKPSGHLNLFQGLQEVSNKEYEEEKKQEKERKEKALGILTYLGQSSAESQTSAPWYQELPDRSKAIAKDEKLKGRLDPLAEMGKYLYKKKCSHKKEEKKEKGKSKHKESKRNLALRPPCSSTSCSLEQLRQERLQREQAERARTESLLAQRSGMGPLREEEEEMDERKRSYNSQFNPQLARKRVVRDSRIEWV